MLPLAAPQYDRTNEHETRRQIDQRFLELTPQAAAYTPVVTSSGGGETVTYTTQLGRYVRHGPLLWIDVHIKLATKSGGSGDIRVSLPAPLATGLDVAFAVYIDNHAAGWTGAPIAWAAAGGAIVTVRELVAGAVAQAWTKVGATGDFRITGAYLPAL